ncbi:hypothetical protein RQP46_003143 [Phenoliferia psychrophenolica]
MATINNLPNETLYHIMEMLEPPSLPVWDMASEYELPPGSYDSLRAAALVCSRWRDPAQRALFDSIRLDTGNVTRRQKFLRSPARARYRTRSLEVLGRALSTDWWLDVARATRGLEELSIRTSIVSQWDLLSDTCFAGLKHLHLVRPEDFKDSTRLNPVLSMRLESLALWLYETVGSAKTSPAFVAALFTASSTSLQTLHLKIFNRESESSIAPSFHLIASNLRSLILESTHDVLEGHLDLLSACTSLEHLALKRDAFEYESDIPNDCPASVLHMQAILEALPSPPTLRHLSLDLDERLDLVPIANLLKHPALGLLAKLGLPRMAVRDGKDVSLEPRRQLEDAVVQALLSMKETCEHRKIECKGTGGYCMWEEEM